MNLIFRTGASGLLAAAGLIASGLPPTSPQLDFTFDSEPTFTTMYNPGGAVITAPFTNFLIRYGTPTGGGNPAQIELFDLGSADWCYGVGCGTPSTPNYYFPLGSLEFIPNSIVAGTGISSINGLFTVNGIMAPPATPPPFTSYSINVSATPTIFTGLDPGGATAYLYMQNSDGSYTNVLHVTVGSSGADVQLQGVLIDPPGSYIFDIAGFGDPGPNGFLTPALPEPSTGMFLVAVLILASAAKFRSRALAAFAAIRK